MEVIRDPIGYCLVIGLQVTALLIERLARVGGVNYDIFGIAVASNF
jgi:hypothetical protein